MNHDNLIGITIGPYKILKKIGEGGMAEVYKGQHIELERPIAIKFMGRFLQAEEQLTERFKREARAIAALRHPNIIMIHDFGVFEGNYYLVMEYIAGSDLRQQMNQRFAQNRPYTPQEVLAIVEQIAAALDYAHAQGIIHRDIKPANIFINTNGEAILGDFGLVMLRDRISQVTMGNTFGTPEYIAPEQALDSRSAVPQSDIYALGGTVYEMVTSRLPFEAETALNLALKHIRENPLPPRHYNPALPIAVENVILQALNKDPQARYPNAKAFFQALQQAWYNNPAPATIVIPKIEGTAPFPPIQAAVIAPTPVIAPPRDEAPPTRKKQSWLWGGLLVIIFIIISSIGYINSRTGAWPFTASIATVTAQETLLPQVAATTPTATPSPIPTVTTASSTSLPQTATPTTLLPISTVSVTTSSTISDDEYKIYLPLVLKGP